MLESVLADRLESRIGALTSDVVFALWVRCPEIDCYRSGKVLFRTHHAVSGTENVPKDCGQWRVWHRTRFSTKAGWWSLKGQNYSFLAWSLDLVLFFVLFCRNYLSWLKPAGARHIPIYMYSVQTNVKDLSAAFCQTDFNCQRCHVVNSEAWTSGLVRLSLLSCWNLWADRESEDPPTGKAELKELLSFQLKHTTP